MTDLFAPPRRALLVLAEDADLRPRASAAMRDRMRALVRGCLVHDRPGDRLVMTEDQAVEFLEAALALAPRLEVRDEALVRSGLAWLDQVGKPSPLSAPERLRRQEAMARALAGCVRAALGDPANG